MDGHGGKRSGAGRPAGSPNRKTRELADRLLAEGLTPLAYLLSVVRDEGAERAQRMDAAKAAAPYCHARLAAIEHSGPDGGPVQFAKVVREIVRAPHTDG